MHITFIGTGSGKTSTRRYHSSIIIDADNHILLLDAGDGTARALLKNNINPLSVDSVLISHFHPDHAGGLSSLVNQMHILKRKTPLAIYVHNNQIEILYSLLHTNLIFPEKLNFNLNVTPFDSDNNTEVTDNINFTSKQNRHVTNKHSIDYVPEKNFISSSFKIHLNDYRIIYTSDVGSPDDLNIFSDKNINFFITETTHISCGDILKAMNELQPDRTILTHIDESDEAELAEFAAANNSLNVELAYDGLKIFL